jgi:methylmalonyl-CoA/ethylmalonyl-CoA epimerase
MSEQKIGKNIVCQVGLIVRDVEASAQAYSEIFGVAKPKIIMTDAPETARTKYKGEPSSARAKLAFFDMGQVSIELIEPVGEPSTWKDFLDARGEGVHHIAFMVKGTDEVVARLEKQGISLIQQGHYTGGMYSYLDSEAKLGVILELLENF